MTSDPAKALEWLRNFPELSTRPLLTAVLGDHQRVRKNFFKWSGHLRCLKNCLPADSLGRWTLIHVYRYGRERLVDSERDLPVACQRAELIGAYRNVFRNAMRGMKGDCGLGEHDVAVPDPLAAQSPATQEGEGDA